MANGPGLEIDLGVDNLNQAVAGFRNLASVLDGMKIVEGFGLAGGVEAAAVLSVIALAATAIRAFVGAINNAIAALSDFAHSRDRLGGTTGETAFLRYLGGAAGVSDIAGAGRRLHEATLNGLGTSTAVGLGLQLRPYEIGSATDEAKLLIQALEGLGKEYKKNPSKAVADARNFHLEDWLDVIRLWDEVGERMKKNAEASEGIFSEEHTNNAIRLHTAVTELALAWQELTTRISNFVIPVITEGIKALTAAIHHPFAFAAGAFAGGPMAGFAAAQALEAQNQAANANTNATNANTMAIRQLSGLFGGGSRTRGALPHGLGMGAGSYLSEELHQHSIRLGAYSVSL